MQIIKVALSLLSLLLLTLLSNNNAATSSNDKKKGDMNSYLKRTGEKYLKDIASKEGIYTLKSGMLVEILKEGTDTNARSPTKFDTCDVTYKGTLKDGNQFDAGTTSFSPNQVIKGWTEAMQLMGEGDKWKLYIPYDLAYGERGSPPKIPGYSPLVFEIEIHKVKSSGGKPVADARKQFQESLATATTEL